ncbi:alanine:cation symporter family protein [Roseibium sp.]|uniref:alanine:cation symporter family protein n=1 Tax=Roseibium sp. TaxID=1936156 RepID=UPI003B52874A
MGQPFYCFGDIKSPDACSASYFTLVRATSTQVVIGAAANLGLVIEFSDTAIFSMGVVNIVELYVLLPVVKRELETYMSRSKSTQFQSAN